MAILILGSFSIWRLFLLKNVLMILRRRLKGLGLNLSKTLFWLLLSMIWYQLTKGTLLNSLVKTVWLLISFRETLAEILILKWSNLTTFFLLFLLRDGDAFRMHRRLIIDFVLLNLSYKIWHFLVIHLFNLFLLTLVLKNFSIHYVTWIITNIEFAFLIQEVVYLWILIKNYLIKNGVFKVCIVWKILSMFKLNWLGIARSF